ncbi:acyl-CoA thioesterase [Sedimentitalea sp. HM32M-2]|uniref:acyl-CoA thioesterase n=1 Tax=Sedimentitalea sp. HM32M-2 TaxID=3351566 RepID=UPI00363B05C6
MTLRYHTPLSPTEQTVFGLEYPQPLAMADRVRWAELDALNHVNNKAYMGWFETLRVAYFDQFCTPFYAPAQRPRLVVRSAEIRYLREMVMGEDYVATARVASFRTTSFTMQQQLWAGDLRAEMSAVMVTLHSDGTGRCPLPDAVRRLFVDRDGAVAQG